MRIGIIGSGHIGGTLAKLFVAAGHEVAVSNSRGPETLAGLVEELGGRAQALTAAEAERFGDLVVVSVPFGRYRELPAEAAAGKVVVDTNNYYPQRDGHFEELDSDHTTSSGASIRISRSIRSGTMFVSPLVVQPMVAQHSAGTWTSLNARSRLPVGRLR